MNLFDKLVSEALKNQPKLSPLRVVVEKEILHHDILRMMRDHHLLTKLTFIGGTCLRYCYDGLRLSEDLDFTGGVNFSRSSLSAMGQTLTENFETKYGLQVSVSEPVKESTNVDTWKIKIITRPESKNLPAQRINIDICAVDSYDVKPMMLRNPYGIDMGTSGLIINAQSREEIYTDKLIAFALRPNRIKYRDIWDIIWLYQQGSKPNLHLLPQKMNERKKNLDAFLNLYNERVLWLREKQDMFKEFKKEMQRFLPEEQIKQTLEQEHLWNFVINLMEEFETQIRKEWNKSH